MTGAPPTTSKREMRKLLLVLALNTAIIGIIAFAVWAFFFGEEWTYYTVGNYDLEQGRFIRILGEKSSRSGVVKLRYEVTQNDKVLVSREDEGSVFLTSAAPAESTEAREFTVVPANQGDLVAITDRNQQDDIVILHDFLANQSWPACGKDNAKSRAMGLSMLLKLQREYPFFSSSALSRYRPQWVWSPKLTHWLVTFPDSTQDSADAPKLALRVFNTRNRLTCLIATPFDSEMFGENSVIGWMGNDVVVLAFDANQIFAWNLVEDAVLSASPKQNDETVRARGIELLNSSHTREQFAIPSPLYLFSPELAPPTAEPGKSPNRVESTSPPAQSPGSGR
jgi:hypothetical protein